MTTVKNEVKANTNSDKENVEYSGSVQVKLDGLTGYDLFEATANNLVFESKGVAKLATSLASQSLTLSLPEAVRGASCQLLKNGGDYPQRVAAQMRYIVGFRKISHTKKSEEKFVASVSTLLERHPLSRISKLVQAVGMYRYRHTLIQEKFIPTNAPVIPALHQGSLPDLGVDSESDLPLISLLAESLEVKFTLFSEDEKREAEKLLVNARKEAKNKRQAASDQMETVQAEVTKLEATEKSLKDAIEKMRLELVKGVAEKTGKKQDVEKAVAEAVKSAVEKKDSIIEELKMDIQQVKQEADEKVQPSKEQLKQALDKKLQAELATEKARSLKLETALDKVSKATGAAVPTEKPVKVEDSEAYKQLKAKLKAAESAALPEKDVNMQAWLAFREEGAADLLACLVNAKKAKTLAKKNEGLSAALAVLKKAMEA